MYIWKSKIIEIGKRREIEKSPQLRGLRFDIVLHSQASVQKKLHCISNSGVLLWIKTLCDIKRSYLLEKIFLYAESVICCDALTGFVNITVCKSLFGDMLDI